MEVTWNLAKCSVKVEGKEITDAFESLAMAVEALSEGSCGLCDSTNIRPSVRNVYSEKDKKTYTYYEFRCGQCYARLSLGQTDEGLFAKRKLGPDGMPSKDGSYTKARGWHKLGKPPSQAQEAPSKNARGARNQQSVPAGQDEDGIPF